MQRSFFGATLILLVSAVDARGGPQQLSFASLIPNSHVIEGFVNPIDFYVFNEALSGSNAGNYKVSLAYAPPNSETYTAFPTQFTGTVPADGGLIPKTGSFLLNTARLGGGDVAVKVTIEDVDTHGTLTQGDSFRVLHHGSPGLFVGGQLVRLKSRNVIVFETGPGTPSSGTGASAPGMQGRSPTSTLNIDSISSPEGSPIHSTLTPQSNLPSNSDPNEGAPFTLYCPVCSSGQQYNTTFTWSYSDGLNDGQQLPGSSPYASQMVSFDVTIDMMEDRALWTINVPGVVPEPSPLSLLLIASSLAVNRTLIRRIPCGE